METKVLLIFVAATATCISLAAVMFVWRMRQELIRFKSTTNKQLCMTSSSVVGMGNRLLELERRLSGLREDQRALSDTQQDFAFTKAKNLVQQGLSTDAIVATSGLSHSEVDLIKLIHAQQSSLPGPVL